MTFRNMLQRVEDHKLTPDSILFNEDFDAFR